MAVGARGLGWGGGGGAAAPRAPPAPARPRAPRPPPPRLRWPRRRCRGRGGGRGRRGLGPQHHVDGGLGLVREVAALHPQQVVLVRAFPLVHHASVQAQGRAVAVLAETEAVRSRAIDVEAVAVVEPVARRARPGELGIQLGDDELLQFPGQRGRVHGALPAQHLDGGGGVGFGAVRSRHRLARVALVGLAEAVRVDVSLDEQRVDARVVDGHARLARQTQLAVEELHVELVVVRHEDGVLDEGLDARRMRGERGLSRHHLLCDARQFLDLLRDGHAGVDQARPAAQLTE